MKNRKRAAENETLLKCETGAMKALSLAEISAEIRNET